jgi:hypothetical protein
MRAATLALLATLLAAGSVDAAQRRNVALLPAFAHQLPQVKRVTRVPVLLPRSLSIGGTYKLYATGGASRSSWDLELAGAPRCGSATACFVASFKGTRNARLPWKKNATLRGSDPAAYKPVTCGGSCSPASFWFLHDGVLYSWQVKDLAARDPRATLVRLANEAIATGPR